MVNLTFSVIRILKKPVSNSFKMYIEIYFKQNLQDYRYAEHCVKCVQR